MSYTFKKEMSKPLLDADLLTFKVGMTGQSSNLFLEDLATINNFLEKNKTLLDIIEEPF